MSESSCAIVMNGTNIAMIKNNFFISFNFNLLTFNKDGPSPSLIYLRPPLLLPPPELLLLLPPPLKPPPLLPPPLELPLLLGEE